MKLPLLPMAALAVIPVFSPRPQQNQQSNALVEIRNLDPQDLRSAAFVLEAPQSLRIEAVAAEPRRERNRWEKYFDGDRYDDDDRNTWPAAGWIIDARTRAVVWDVRTAETSRDRNGLRRFAGEVRLPAGTYVAYFASYVATSTNFTGDININNISTTMREMHLRRDRRLRYSGPYIDDGSYRELALVISGAGRRATGREEEDARQVFTAYAIAQLLPDSAGQTMRYGFVLDRSTEVEVLASGELGREDLWDYGWIINAETRRRVWTMDFRHSEPAGGAFKNRQQRDTLTLPAGRYVAYYVTDDSHDPVWWNSMPPFDPGLYGLTLRIADDAARSRVRTFEYEPVPRGQTIVSMTGIGDGELRNEGFTLRRPMEVRIYAIGEGSENDQDGHMYDFAWIVDAATRRRVWTMRYEDTEHAGGADKNRLFDGTVRLDAGSYLVYYKSDDSHSYRDWNSSPPAEARYWGVSVFPASGTLDRSALAPFERPASNALAELVRMRDDVNARRTFEVDREQRVRVYAIGEGMSNHMYDFGWIEDAATGRTVWEMSYRLTSDAGGAGKNRVFDGVITLPAGRYILHWESDGSHSFEDWNDDPPDDPEAWGITVSRVP